MRVPQHSLVNPEDPSAVLEVSIDASPEDIRAAYLRKVREFPPERSPDEFEKVRDAYSILRDPGKRIQMMFARVDPGAPLVSLIESEKPVRRHVGPEVWLEVVKEN